MSRGKKCVLRGQVWTLDKISAEGIMKSEEKRVEDIDITSVAQNVQCPDLTPYILYYYIKKRSLL